MRRRVLMPVSLVAILGSGTAVAASAGEHPWLTWLVVGAVLLFVVGIAVRMYLSARFPAGYRRWARERREAFAARNEQWDNDDDAFRK